LRLCRSEQVTLWSNYLELLPGSTLSKPPLQSSYGSLDVCAYIQNIQEEALLNITRTQFQIIFHKDWDMAVLGLSFPFSKLIFAKKYISNKLISAYCVRMCWALFTAKFSLLSSSNSGSGLACHIFDTKQRVLAYCLFSSVKLKKTFESILKVNK